MSNYVIVGGGWNGTSKNGEKFLRIRFKTDIPENVNVIMYKNKKKSQAMSPDYVFFMAANGEDFENNEENVF
jgi:uncharacterized protein (DUF736 family)